MRNTWFRKAAFLALSFGCVAGARAGDSYTWKSVTIKANGFIDGIVYSPAKEGVTFIHTDMGGAYRWDEASHRWWPLNDSAKWNDPSMRNLGVEALVVDPTDASKAYMACGTYMSPTAIRRTTDGGRTWTRVDTPIRSNGNGSARNAGPRMSVDPNSPNILFYGTRLDGLWRSDDSAATWKRVEGFPTVGDQSGWGKDTGIIWTCIDKSSATAGKPSQTIYAGVFIKRDGAPRIYRSLDGGATWQPLPGKQITQAGYFPQRVALTPDGKTLYLTFAHSTIYPGPYGIDAGCVQKITNPASDQPHWADVSPKVRYGFSACTLDPTDSRRVYVSEMGNYNPNDRIWRSDDAGEHWKSIDPSKDNRDDSSAPYASSSKVHWMGDVQIDPFNHDVAMFTTGYGLYRTTNLTGEVPKWTFFNDGFEQSAVTEFASPASGPVNLISSIGDRDGYRHADFDQSPEDGVLGQKNGLAMGTNVDIDVASKDANQVIRLGHAGARVQYSTDNGVNWHWFPKANTPEGRGEDGIAISADGKRAVYEPAGPGRTLYSIRNGDSWSAWTQPKTGQPADDSNLVGDLQAPETFYAFAGENVSRSTDGGATWKGVSTNAPRMRWVRAIPGHVGHLLGCASDQGAFHSTDGGATWTRLAPQSLTVANVVGVGAGKNASAYPSLFAGGTCNGETGFFRSDDAGKTWTTISDPEHQFGWVTVIQGDARVYGRLYVGTNGRGILCGDIAK